MWFAIASQHLSVLVSVLAVPTKTCLESRIKKSKPISGLKWAGNGTWVPGYGLDDCTGLKGDETVGPLSEQIRQFVPRLDLSCMVSECPFTGQTTPTSVASSLECGIKMRSDEMVWAPRTAIGLCRHTRSGGLRETKCLQVREGLQRSPSPSHCFVHASTVSYGRDTSPR